MSTGDEQLRPVSEVTITSVVDNSLEMLSVLDRWDTQRLWDWTPDPDRARYPLAEHGLSLLVQTQGDQGSHTIIFDVAHDPDSVIDNSERMLLDLSPVEAIVLSHGHMDHTGGLLAVLEFMGANELPVVTHPAMFQVRGWREPEVADSRMEVPPPNPSPAEIEAAGAVITEAIAPYLMCNDTILVTGEVPRITDFEPGLPNEWVLENGQWRLDPRVVDDRSIVMHVQGRGLVVVAGCAHAGIVNTLEYARELTGVERVAAIIGGFHMAGKYFEPNIPKTVQAIQQLNPDLLVPSHCTGWPGRLALAQACPAAFVPGSVGNRYRIRHV